MKPPAVVQLGPEGALRAVHDALGDAAARAALISFALPLLEAARRESTLPVAPILTSWEQHEDHALRALHPEWVFVNADLLPPGPLPACEWDWVVYETVDPAAARGLLARGAQLVETFAFAEMSAALEQAR